MSTATDVSNLSTLYDIARVFALPDYVQQSTKSATDTDDLGLHFFADPKNRQYPCHSKAATWLSAAAMLKKHAGVPRSGFDVHAWKRIKDTAQYYNISEDLEKVAEAAVVLNEEEDLSTLPNEDFAFVRERKTDTGGYTERQYPLRNAAEVKAAAQHFLKYAAKMPFSQRHESARRIFDKALELRTTIGPSEVSESVAKSAGEGFGVLGNVTDGLRARGDILMGGKTQVRRDVGNRLYKLADTLETTADEFSALSDPNQAMKIARTVAAKDEQFGLNKLYGTRLEAPEDMFFSLTSHRMKEGAAQLTRHTASGSLYKKADVSAITYDVLVDALPEVAAEVSLSGNTVDTEKLASLLPTLDQTQARIFDNVARAQGIKPARVTPTDEERKPVDLKQAADEHTSDSNVFDLYDMLHGDS